MAKFTLLQIVQDILNDMDSDEVNSIDDTFEAQQVAQIVRTSYNSMMANRNWPHLREITSLTASGDSSLPTVMYLSDDVKEVVSVNYNTIKADETRKNYKEVQYIEIDDFLRHTNARNDTNSDTDVMTYKGTELLILNDKAPKYYTSFDDKELVFDSYDSGVDSTLQASKTQLVVYRMPSLIVTDNSIPDLPDEAFPALIEEARSRAMLRLKQQVDQKAESEARRQQRWLSNKARRTSEGDIYPNYGRKARKMAKDPTFRKN